MVLPVLVLILVSVLVVSAISLIGILTLLLNEKRMQNILPLLISFAAGSLLAAAFLDILPEALELNGTVEIFTYVLIGIIVFFILESFLYWYHCHDGKCDVHTFTYLNIIGDGIHNFIDGMIIATSYLISIPLGAITSLAVVFHEVPQEIGDFSILVYGGFSKARALLYNFLTALTSFAGALAVYFFSAKVQNLTAFLLPFAAGGFIYIAGADLLPELHKEAEHRRTFFQLMFFLIGITIMWLATIVVNV